jgi:diaminohydroxyphosphoribosylaminopyrimidine deaminase/5-amino-6-(5-phosphoribosylamino)uracil reductase
MVRRALELAAAGQGLASPNPLVGCVILSADGKVVGEGTYTYDGVDHAEMIALAQAGERAHTGTAYVSLEPHSHQGRTPPCTKALIAAGIRRVVAPVEDPNPLVAGRGFEQLRENAIEVVHGLLAAEARQLNEKFFIWHEKQRPFVHLKLAMSLDGRISLSSSVSTAISNPEAIRRVHELRHEHDAILVGGNTAVIDDPMLTDRSGNKRRRPLVRIVLDNRMRLSLKSRLVKTAPDVPTIVFSSSSDWSRRSQLVEAGIDAPEIDSRDLKQVLQYLRQKEIQSVLVEGGTEVAGAFVDAGLVDKITFIAAPIILGGREAPVAIGGQGVRSIFRAPRLTNLQLKNYGDDIEITGYPQFSE